MENWHAKWVGYAYDPREDLGVFAFRTCLVLDAVPESLRIRISADNRYKLYVNGEMVVFGPQRGDERHWFYETLDLAPFLQTGENWIVALVWNFGRWAPMAQHSARTGFMLECDDDRLRTPGEWKVARLEGWDFAMMHRGVGEFYIDVGPGEVLRSGSSATVDGVIGEPGRDLTWHTPHVICSAEPRGANSGGTPWMLIPRSLPLMRYQHRDEPPLVRNRSDEPFDSATLADGEFLLLDYGELLCAYPRVFVSSKGRSVVTLTYDEALWSESGKGNRNEVEGKESRGYQDRIEIDSWSLAFEPLWWRTYRYLRIEVAGDPVSISEINALETGYPLEVQSSFEADDPWVKPIWDVSVRTAERCAGETYFDCPYYEQLQYVGDTRIQALIGYYLGRDRALQRNAVETLGWSIMENGLTQSRYPSRQTQVIPPFSLWWVMMLYDQMLYDYRPSPANGASAGRIVDSVGDYHSARQEFWQFTDWVPEWRAGIAPGGRLATTSWLLRMLAVGALHDLPVITEQEEDNLANQAKDDEQMRELTALLASSDVRMSAMMLDQAEKSTRSEEGLRRWKRDRQGMFSEHAEALYRLVQASGGAEMDSWPKEALAAANAAKCTFYFSYYKHLAMFGREDAPFDYMTELQPWKQMIEDGGLTTFAETPEPTRSDCHAWSAHPILGFFQIVAGVTSVAPGWKKARIMPHPGSLKHFDARIAHPDGELRVSYEGKRLTIDTPVPSVLEWKGKPETLAPGLHTVG